MNLITMSPNAMAIYCFLCLRRLPTPAQGLSDGDMFFPMAVIGDSVVDSFIAGNGAMIAGGGVKLSGFDRCFYGCYVNAYKLNSSPNILAGGAACMMQQGARSKTGIPLYTRGSTDVVCEGAATNRFVAVKSPLQTFPVDGADDIGGCIDLAKMNYSVGKLPRNQVAQDMVESYIKEEKEKRSKLLQNYLDMCSNAKMKAETVLIESDMAHKSLVELITDLQITKLVIGTKPAIHPMTRKLKKMGPGKAEYVQRHAPHFCEVFVICEGKIIFPKVRDFKYSDASSTTLSRHVADDQRGEDAINCMGFYRRILR